ncbi:hypothetical protein HanPSC8_Chr05g0223211 [Helianthus annuus]|nr:hypothetical protein HanIR_Chr05g0244131 [Helianthus annuus]KAJ0924001.1 hypothetical protein HanPSC8_Chr05g0223211 [Helianthus annuus]
MAASLSSVIDQVRPPDMPNSSGVEEQSLTVYGISEDNIITGPWVFISSCSCD